MKYFILSLISFFSYIQSSYAEDSIFGISYENLREGRVHAKDIPGAITGAIDFFMSIAGTIAVIFVVIGAYKILFGSLQQDKTKGRDTIIMALGGFALAALAWVIIKIIINNFT